MGAVQGEQTRTSTVAPTATRVERSLVTKSSGSTQTSSEHKIGDVVQFNGGYHYVNSTASKPTGSRCNAGPAKITHIAKGKAHPWHLEHTDSKSRVFGWVDDGTFS